MKSGGVLQSCSHLGTDKPLKFQGILSKLTSTIINMEARLDPNNFPEPGPIFGIAYDINCPANGGVAVNIPPNHPNAGHHKSWYYSAIKTALVNNGYTQRQYSMSTAPVGTKNRAQAMLEATLLETQPNCSWMELDGVMQSMHVIQLSHEASFY